MIQARLFNLHEVQVSDRVQFYDSCFGVLADKLSMYLAFRWHINHDIALQIAVTGQATSVDQGFLFGEAYFRRRNRGEVITG